jgi:hypothetical protein
MGTLFVTTVWNEPGAGGAHLNPCHWSTGAQGAAQVVTVVTYHDFVYSNVNSIEILVLSPQSRNAGLDFREIAPISSGAHCAGLRTFPLPLLTCAAR